jgi:shikimate dehydrogenase
MEKEMEGTLEQIQKCISNTLPSDAYNAKLIGGVIGESPSRYSKSPSLWNAAFREIGIDAHYVPIDVEQTMLRTLLHIFRRSQNFFGANVTVPHKLAVMEHLDEIDPIAKAIGAVNTIVRTPTGKLHGYNTDADGLLSSLLRKPSESEAPFLSTLEGKRVILIGSGGAGQAAAFGLANVLEGGGLYIANRTKAKSDALVAKVRDIFPQTRSFGITEIPSLITNADVIINASTVGQSGLRPINTKEVTYLEPYSPLAPANPVAKESDPTSTDESMITALTDASAQDIETNNRVSIQILQTSNSHLSVVDLIYSPTETTFLKQARMLGHATLNGQRMLLFQAAEAFANRLMKPHLELSGNHGNELYFRVFGAMLKAW